MSSYKSNVIFYCLYVLHLNFILIALLTKSDQNQPDETSVGNLLSLAVQPVAY